MVKPHIYKRDSRWWVEHGYFIRGRKAMKALDKAFNLADKLNNLPKDSFTWRGTCTETLDIHDSENEVREYLQIPTAVDGNILNITTALRSA